MAVIIIPSRRMRQPVGWALARASGPFANGLVNAWTFGLGPQATLSSVAGGETLAVGTGTLAATRLLDLGGVNMAQGYTSMFTGADTAAQTSVIVASTATHAAGSSLIASSTGNCVFADASNKIALYLSSSLRLTGNTVMDAKRPNVIGFRNDSSGGYRFYLNGALDSVTTVNGWGTLAGRSIGCRGTPYNGPIKVFALFQWSRYLSDAEHLEFAQNPWQLFAPDQRRLYFGVSGGVTTTDAAIAGTQATDVGAITVEATTGAAIAGTQATDVGAVTVEATTGAAIAGTQASDIAAIDVTASTGETEAAIAGVQASDVGAVAVSATLGLALSGTQASDLGYIVVEATLPAAIAGIEASNVAAVTATTTAGVDAAIAGVEASNGAAIVVDVSIWTDVGVSAATWSDVGGASSIWSDL